MPIQLDGKKDRFVWGLTSSATFTVKSMYLDMPDDDTKYLKKYIWKIFKEVHLENKDQGFNVVPS
jgi:hypothetical protein